MAVILVEKKTLIKVCSVMCGIQVTGIGPAAAAKLVSEGVTTIEELRKHQDQLTHHQRLGLKYYDDFQQRIPRAEMLELEALVVEAVRSVDAKCRATVCGSFRRGAASSGDLDVLLSHPDFTSTSGKRPSLLCDVVAALRRDDIVVDVISHGESKFAGVCHVPAAKSSLRTLVEPKAKRPKMEDHDMKRRDSSVKQEVEKVEKESACTFRRIDLRLIPSDQYFFGILFFTGSDMFNMHMRAVALEEGFTLSEYSIRPLGSTGVAGEPIPVESEKEIFDLIGMQYLPPEKRNK